MEILCSIIKPDFTTPAIFISLSVKIIFFTGVWPVPIVEPLSHSCPKDRIYSPFLACSLTSTGSSAVKTPIIPRWPVGFTNLTRSLYYLGWVFCYLVACLSNACRRPLRYHGQFSGQSSRKRWKQEM